MIVLGLAFGAVALAIEACRQYRLDVRTRGWTVVLAEVIETLPTTTLERDGWNFSLRSGCGYALRWMVDGCPIVRELDATVSLDLGGWVVWQRPLRRKPWRVRYDPADPLRNEIEANVRAWRWYGLASAALAIAASIVHAMH